MHIFVIAFESVWLSSVWTSKSTYFWYLFRLLLCFLWFCSLQTYKCKCSGIFFFCGWWERVAMQCSRRWNISQNLWLIKLTNFCILMATGSSFLPTVVFSILKSFCCGMWVNVVEMYEKTYFVHWGFCRRCCEYAETSRSLGLALLYLDLAMIFLGVFCIFNHIFTRQRICLFSGKESAANSP